MIATSAIPAVSQLKMRPKAMSEPVARIASRQIASVGMSIFPGTDIRPSGLQILFELRAQTKDAFVESIADDPGKCDGACNGKRKKEDVFERRLSALILTE